MQIKKNKYSGFESKARCRKSTGTGKKNLKCYLLVTTQNARNTTGYIISSGAPILEGKVFGWEAEKTYDLLIPLI